MLKSLKFFLNSKIKEHVNNRMKKTIKLNWVNIIPLCENVDISWSAVYMWPKLGISIYRARYRYINKVEQITQYLSLWGICFYKTYISLPSIQKYFIYFPRKHTKEEREERSGVRKIWKMIQNSSNNSIASCIISFNSESA